MNQKKNGAKKIGIIICDRYRTCAGGKCFRALEAREGAFSIYQGREVEVVGYTTCEGCPGGNIEYAPEEMMKNGAQTIHLATGFVVGYPPCPFIAQFRDFIRERYDMDVVVAALPSLLKDNQLDNRSRRSRRACPPFSWWILCP